jgi:protein-L-isoaspartate(D-aspartate) O-methyltransferase
MDMASSGTYKAREVARPFGARIARSRRHAGKWMAEAALAPTQSAPTQIDETQNAHADTAHLRKTMVERQLRTFDVTDVPVLQRFLDVPREAFLPGELASLAYSDMAFSLKDASGRKTRALLPPLVLARFLQGGDIRPHHKVLDIGGGAGFTAALLSGLAAEVVALESDAALAEQAKANLHSIGATNVRVEIGPLEKGVAGAGPFDVILVEGAVESNVDALLEQLTPDGHLLAIRRADHGGGQQVVRFEKSNGLSAGERPLFDAGAPVLPGFEKSPAFEF